MIKNGLLFGFFFFLFHCNRESSVSIENSPYRNAMGIINDYVQIRKRATWL